MPFVEEARARPGLGRGLVVGKAGVPVDPEQGPADAARVGAVVFADLAQVRLQVGDQAQERLRRASGAFLELLEERFVEWALTPAERDLVLGGTAIGVYRLPLPTAGAESGAA